MAEERYGTRYNRGERNVMWTIAFVILLLVLIVWGVWYFSRPDVGVTTGTTTEGATGGITDDTGTAGTTDTATGTTGADAGTEGTAGTTTDETTGTA